MSRRIEDCHPKLQPMVLAHVDAATRLGLRVQVIETWRDAAMQQAAFDSGASKARPGQSWHNVTYPTGKPAAMAYHLAIIVPGGLLGFGESKLGDAGVRLYEAVGLLGEHIGVTWGGRWRMKDYTHFEWHPNGATLSQVIAAMNAQGDLTAILGAT